MPAIELTAARVVELFDPTCGRAPVGRRVSSMYNVATSLVAEDLASLAKLGVVVPRAGKRRKPGAVWSWVEPVMGKSPLCAFLEIGTHLPDRWDLALDVHLANVGDEAREVSLAEVARRITGGPVDLEDPSPQGRNAAFFALGRIREMVGADLIRARGEAFVVTRSGQEVATWMELFLRNIRFRHRSKRCWACLRWPKGLARAILDPDDSPA